jgi:hypothetical protein
VTPSWIAWGIPAAFAALCIALLVWRRPSTSTKGPVPAASSRSLQDAPDWSVLQLFSHLSARMPSGQSSNARQEIGQKILEQVSTGRLKVWGRMIGSHTLVAMDPGYWKHVDFTYLFLGDEDASQVWSTKPREGHKHKGLPQYRDLHVNKAEALGIWPQK